MIGHRFESTRCITYFPYTPASTMVDVETKVDPAVVYLNIGSNCERLRDELCA